jgi:hypothetical protein
MTDDDDDDMKVSVMVLRTSMVQVMVKCDVKVTVIVKTDLRVIRLMVAMVWALIDGLLLTLLFVMLVNVRTVLTKQCVVRLSKSCLNSIYQ